MEVVQKTLFRGILSQGIGSWTSDWKRPRAVMMGTMSLSWELRGQHLLRERGVQGDVDVVV